MLFDDIMGSSFEEYEGHKIGGSQNNKPGFDPLLHLDPAEDHAAGRIAAVDRGEFARQRIFADTAIATSLPDGGDPGGMRKWLFDRGLSYSFVLTSEVLGDVAGGMRTGAVFQGTLETIVKADLDKMFGLRGSSFFANSFQIHNTGGSRRKRHADQFELPMNSNTDKVGTMAA
jgi:hypothetical protein